MFLNRIGVRNMFIDKYTDIYYEGFFGNICSCSLAKCFYVCYTGEKTLSTLESVILLQIAPDKSVSQVL